MKKMPTNYRKIEKAAMRIEHIAVIAQSFKTEDLGKLYNLLFEIEKKALSICVLNEERLESAENSKKKRGK